MTVHSEIYRHSPQCPKYAYTRGKCTCERPRYRNVMILGFAFVGIEYSAGWAIFSDAIRGDAAHMGTDVVSDSIAWTIAGLAGTYPHIESRFRAWGGYIQACMLVLAAGLILREVYANPDPHDIEAWWMIAIGCTATLVNWWRYKILHPEGSLWKLFCEILRSLSEGKRELTTFIGEIFHVILDIGVSIIATIGGVAILLTGKSTFDDWSAWVMATLVLLGAIVVVIFARRHDHYRKPRA